VIELRKAARYELRLPIRIVRQGRQKMGNNGETRNVSANGVLFVSDASVAVGDPIEYHITLMNMPGEVRLSCKGHVLRHVDGNEFAATLERHEFVRVTK
jgi:hypothetical protein